MKGNRIFLIGPMGAGKTTVGAKLAVLLAHDFLDSDLIIQKQTNCSIVEIFHKYGEDFFRVQEKLLLEQVGDSANIVFATGGGCILSAENRSLLKKDSLVCYLKVSAKEQQQRLLSCTDRPLLPRDQKLWLEYLQLAQLQRGALYEATADLAIATDGMSIDAVTEQLLATIRSRQCVT
jgi:shikimate kinase